MAAARCPFANELIITDSLSTDILSEPRARVVIAQRVVREAAQFQRNVQATDAMKFNPQGGFRPGTIL